MSDSDTNEDPPTTHLEEEDDEENNEEESVDEEDDDSENDGSEEDVSEEFGDAEEDEGDDELTCTICFCQLECPLTIPCGHIFCQDCLIAACDENYRCPQCLTQFGAKEEWKKVINAYVETLMMESKNMSDPCETTAEVEEQTEAFPLCDMCMASKAFKTCLTCMTSFCVEHFRPHQENPNLRLHQLSEPLVDLQDRICQDHQKVMEFFCVQHGRSICSFCLQQVHKGCTFSTPDEQRALKQSDFKQKLLLLDGKIEKTNSVISQVQDLQNRMKDTACQRKRVYEAEFQQMREMLDREEREALNTVDREQQSAQMKLDGFLKKFTMNVEKMSDAKTSITSLLGQSQTVAFLQASVNLPSVIIFDPYTPCITLDTKPMLATHAFTSCLKEHLESLFRHPVEARLAILRPGEGAVSESNKLSTEKNDPGSHPPTPSFTHPGIPAGERTPFARTPFAFNTFLSQRSNNPGFGETHVRQGFANFWASSQGTPLRMGQKNKPQNSFKKMETKKHHQRDHRPDRNSFTSLIDALGTVLGEGSVRQGFTRFTPPKTGAPSRAGQTKTPQGFTHFRPPSSGAPSMAGHTKTPKEGTKPDPPAQGQHKQWPRQETQQTQHKHWPRQETQQTQHKHPPKQEKKDTQPGQQKQQPKQQKQRPASSKPAHKQQAHPKKKI